MFNFSTINQSDNLLYYILLLIGFLIGLGSQFYIGIDLIKFFLVWGILNATFLMLTIMFRFFAGYSINFEVTFAEYLQDQFLKAVDCCFGMTVIPQTTYKITTYYDSGRKSKRYETTNYTCYWGLFEMFIFYLISYVSPILLFFILYLYILTFYRIHTKYGQEKMQEMLKMQRQYERNNQDGVEIPNVLIQKNGQFHTLNDLPNATVTVYTVPSASNTAREPLTNTNNIYANNNYPNNNYPVYNNYPPNYYNGPTYPNPPNNYIPNHNINYVPMPTNTVTVDTTQRNLVIYG